MDTGIDARKWIYVLFVVGYIPAVWVLLPGIPTGDDTSTHLFFSIFMINELKIAGHMPAWFPYWYCGIIAFPFYEPGFPLIVNDLHLFSGINPFLSYKMFVFFSYGLVNFSLYILARSFELDEKTTAVTLLFFQLTNGFFYQVIRIGGSTTAIGLFFLCTYVTFLKKMKDEVSQESYKSTILSGIFLSAIFLTHYTTFFAAILLFTLFLLINRNISILKHILGSFLIFVVFSSPIFVLLIPQLGIARLSYYLPPASPLFLVLRSYPAFIIGGLGLIRHFLGDKRLLKLPWQIIVGLFVIIAGLLLFVNELSILNRFVTYGMVATVLGLLMIGKNEMNIPPKLVEFGTLWLIACSIIFFGSHLPLTPYWPELAEILIQRNLSNRFVIYGSPIAALFGGATISHKLNFKLSKNWRKEQFLPFVIMGLVISTSIAIWVPSLPTGNEVIPQGIIDYFNEQNDEGRILLAGCGNHFQLLPIYTGKSIFQGHRPESAQLDIFKEAATDVMGTYSKIIENAELYGIKWIIVGTWEFFLLVDSSQKFSVVHDEFVQKGDKIIAYRIFKTDAKISFLDVQPSSLQDRFTYERLNVHEIKIAAHNVDTPVKLLVKEAYTTDWSAYVDGSEEIKLSQNNETGFIEFEIQKQGSYEVILVFSLSLITSS
ncbi:hypothetical protein [Candidatus Borrarchaeum sp.]|uniref:hypothetical protein n=1 Tax=Candidatus Borrarchaeum sp. TaxID=2846742 RepID=UPI002579884C|nr:hypothetical protein [Candidatus Borrarchaeum sp.]